MFLARVHGRTARALAPVLAIVLMADAVHVAPRPATAAPTGGRPAVAESREPVRGTVAPVRPRPASWLVPAAPARATWPKPATAVLTASGATARVGDLPVRITPVRPAAPGSRSATAPPVRVEVLGQDAARAAGVRGVLVRLTPVGGRSTVRLSIGYADFAAAYGGDFGARLRLLGVPSRNDTAARTVTAEMPTDGLFALAAGDASSQGDYAATPLSPSAKWSVAPSSGAFAWAYPMRTPPVPGGLAPNVELSYSSQIVDGRTAATNNQGSWVGEGFGYEPGYIERSYKTCEDDGHDGMYDQCWAGDVVQIVLNGRSTQLVRDDESGAWRLRDDDGSRVEALTDADTGNGDNDGEHWRVTTLDGTQYHFGLNRLPGWSSGAEETASTWTVPVFGDDAGEPCYSATFADASCRQAWRWNLDYVTDPHGNAMAYFYGRETNHYAQRGRTDVDGVAYHRGGYLKRVDYGLRDGQAYAAPPARVLFATAERCIPSGAITCAAGQLTEENARHWPDVPWDRNCATGVKCQAEQKAPTFWTRMRLTKVTTQARVGGALADVDSWSLTHVFTDNGDASRSLWLSQITHAAGTLTLPSLDLEPRQLANRVDGPDDGISGLIRPRLAAIYTESGGQTVVNYAATECALGSLPSPGDSTKRCFPVKWSPPGTDEPITDWFHKYVVAEVIETDRTGGNGDMVTRYEYLGDAGWRYAEPDGISEAKYRTWSDWRGYGKVRVRGGDGQTMTTRTEYTYLRGLNGNKDPGGGTREVSVADSTGTEYVDHEHLSGHQLESAVYNGSAVVSKMITTPWSNVTATATPSWGMVKAHLVRTATTLGFAALSTGGWRQMRATATYDPSLGRLTRNEDLGDVSTAADDRCTRISHADNAAAWLRASTSRVETVAVACDASVDRRTKVISDERAFFDGQGFGATPTKGDVTTVQKLATHDGTAASYLTVEKRTFDAFGRPLTLTDAAGATTITEYTETGGLTTRTRQTNALRHAQTVEYNPARGQRTAQADPNGKTVHQEYDALGRLVSVWMPDRPKDKSPSLRYTYTVRADAPVTLKVEWITNAGGYQVEYQLFDGLLRPRQTQAPGPDGGRVVTDTYHNAIGKVARTNGTYYAAGAPAGQLLVVPGGAVDRQTIFVYDGAARATAEITAVAGEELWRTTTTYDGDRTHVDPPAGQTPTTTIGDTRNNTLELRQYHGDAPTGPYDATRYTYTPAGHTATVTDAAGNVWRYGYDQRGRKVAAEDPDAGSISYGYDDLDRLTSVTDGRGLTRTTTYDALGRKTAVHEGNTQLAGWTYDTVHVGQLSYAQRFAGGSTYTTAYPLRDDFYRPRVTRYIIPAAEGVLAGTYDFSTTYNMDGTAQGIALPAAGGLPAESIAYSYDGLRRRTKVTSNLASYVTSALYDQTGHLRQVELTAGGPKTWITYGMERGTERLVRSQVHRELGGVTTEQSDVRIGYDPGGNVTALVDTPAAGEPDAQCFAYDHLRRLTEARATGYTDPQACANAPAPAGPAPYHHSYTYDKTGNRLTETLHGIAEAADTVREYEYPAAGQKQPHTLTGIKTTMDGAETAGSYRYDPAGNTVERPGVTGQQTLNWDAEGHLTSVTEGGRTTSFVYDPDGNRLLRREPGVTTLYLGGMELRLDTATRVVAGTRYYDLGGGARAVRTPAGVSFLAGDHLNTAQVTVDAASGQITRRRTTPFGAVRGSPPAAWPGEKGFVGGAIDASTGLTHLGAREYDPAIGRFISIDPIMDDKDPQQIHGYSYSNNNPTTLSDPDGLLPAPLDPSDPNGFADTSQGTPQKGSDPAHGTAIALRLANLQRMYPHARISHDIQGDRHGADLICWDCVPGEVWVWEFKTAKEYRNHSKAVRTQLDGYLNDIKNDPRAEGRNVIRGPMFDPAQETGANRADSRELITVKNVEEDGIQVYDRTRFRDKVDSKMRQKTDDAYEVASDAQYDADAYLDVLVHPADPGAVRSDPVGDTLVTGAVVVTTVVVGAAACVFLCVTAGAAAVTTWVLAA
ncbi:RHS repeat-associated core domain-containing protein [Phytohabitans aurantiacus]|uniref:Type IV secretion protein Rhs n=1 Tax=Phytohabitans aurantiacus TaxID=3016789 RepID=A0ABQ5RA53_9ACTN|nr:RHS repeat-associated core domain-containing protein [Phytohabitans aurantiacus]GLI02451.1 type IV secretion protein Rhs [Phytohabitans aurantiacus]